MSNTKSELQENSEISISKKSGWIEKVEKITKIIERLVWIFILTIIATSVANFLKIQSLPSGDFPPTDGPIPIEKPIPGEAGKEVYQALKATRIATIKFAETKFESWESDVMRHVDDSFLPWYFGYWNQQGLGIKYLAGGTYHLINSKSKTPEQYLENLIQKEFENRALPPEINQLLFDEIIEDSVKFYTQELSQKIDVIPTHYKIPKEAWDRYINDISRMTEGSEASREVPLPEKTIVATTLGATQVLQTQIASKLAAKGVSKLAAQEASTLAAQGASKLAAKSSAKFAGKLGAKFLGPVLGVGIIAWDVWDHYHTKSIQLPILRQNIKLYLDQVKTKLLTDPKTGLISVIYDLEKQTIQASKAKGVV